MNLIAAVDKNWAIGKNNELLVRIPMDQKFFRETTTGKVVVMGRKTLESFPNGLPLKNRTNIVLTHNPNYKVNGAIVVHSLDELHEELKKYNSEDVYVIEVNPRSSRTVPYISKVTGIPIVPLATRVILGHKIKELGYTPGLQKEAEYFAIKMPVFSFEKIRGADISLGPEMKSTGECLGIAKTFNEALYKAFIGAGIRLPKHKQMIITVKDEDKKDIIPIAKRFEAQGYRIFATRGTASVLTENGIKVTRTNKLEQPSPNLMDLILGHKIDVVIDTPPQGVEHQKDGFVIRRNAIETGVNVLTSLDTAEALVTSLENTDLNHLTLVDIATIDNR